MCPRARTPGRSQRYSSRSRTTPPSFPSTPFSPQTLTFPTVHMLFSSTSAQAWASDYAYCNLSSVPLHRVAPLLPISLQLEHHQLSKHPVLIKTNKRLDHKRQCFLFSVVPIGQFNQQPLLAYLNQQHRHLATPRSPFPRIVKLAAPNMERHPVVLNLGSHAGSLHFAILRVRK